MQTLVGMYENLVEAQQAAAALIEAGFDQTTVDIVGDDEGDEITLKSLPRRVPSPDVDVYIEGVRHGDLLVLVDADNERLQEAGAILARFHMIDPDRRVTTLQNAATTPITLRAFDPARDYVLPVIEEQLDIGTREVERRRMRVYQRITETPVERQIGLRDETIRVQRRRVDRPVTETDRAQFVERSIEIREIDEEAVLSKTARVVEEVVVGKDAVEQTQTIRDTLRRSNVVVDDHQTPAVSIAEPAARALALGSLLATNEPYRGNDWASVAPHAERMWEGEHPGTWQEHEDKVRAAWAHEREQQPQTLLIDGSSPQPQGELY